MSKEIEPFPLPYEVNQLHPWAAVCRRCEQLEKEKSDLIIEVAHLRAMVGISRQIETPPLNVKT